MHLPAYLPPSTFLPWLAVGVSPALAAVAHWLHGEAVIGSDAMLAVVTGCAAWVVAELHAHQSAARAYDDEYFRLHLAWRAPETVVALAHQPGTSPATRRFALAQVAVHDSHADTVIG